MSGARDVGWATFVTVRSDPSGRLARATAVVNLMLGLLIVLLKSALHH